MMATSVTIEGTAPNDGGTPRVVARQQANAAAGTGAFSFMLPAGVGVAYTVILRDTATMAMRDQVLLREVIALLRQDNATGNKLTGELYEDS